LKDKGDFRMGAFREKKGDGDLENRSFFRN